MRVTTKPLLRTQAAVSMQYSRPLIIKIFWGIHQKKSFERIETCKSYLCAYTLITLLNTSTVTYNTIIYSSRQSNFVQLVQYFQLLINHQINTLKTFALLEELTDSSSLQVQYVCKDLKQFDVTCVHAIFIYAKIHPSF